MLARSLDALPSWAQRILNAITLFILVFPVGLLLRGAGNRQALLAVTVLVVVLPVDAWYSGLALPSAWDSLGVLAALGTGGALHRRLHPP